MFRTNEEISKKYFPILKKFFRYNKTAKIKPVDFDKPWWQIIWDQKFAYLMFLFGELLSSIFLSLVPLIIGFIVNSGQYYQFSYLILTWLSIMVLLFVTNYFYMAAMASVETSVHYYAVRFFLTVDPIFHSTRSSGQVISKINRGSESYEAVTDLLTSEIFRIVVKVLTLGITIITFNQILGWFSLISSSLIIIISIVSKILITLVTSASGIIDGDDLKATDLETLREIYLVRSAFAGPEQDKKIRFKSHKFMSTLATYWFSNTVIDFVVRIIYILTVAIFGYILFDLLQNGKIDLVIGLSIMVSYIANSNDIIRIGQYFERLTSRIMQIRDMFKFIREFGKQTYPVLGERDLK